MNKFGVSEIVGSIFLIVIFVIALIILFNLLNNLKSISIETTKELNAISSEVESRMQLVSIKNDSKFCYIKLRSSKFLNVQDVTCKAINVSTFNETTIKCEKLEVQGIYTVIRIPLSEVKKLNNSILSISLITSNGIVKKISITFAKPKFQYLFIPPLNISTSGDVNKIQILLDFINNSTGLMYINLTKIQVNGTNYLKSQSGFSCSIDFPIKPRPYTLNVGQDVVYVVNATCSLKVNTDSSQYDNAYDKIIANITINLGCGIKYRYINLTGTVIYIH